jgi:RNA polymerase sigma-70 factor (ECF subfamily)
MLVDSTAESSVRWVDLVQKIASGDEAGIEEIYPDLYDVVRLNLLSTVDPQCMEDTIHEVLLIVLETIRRGELREPVRLMGFVKTVAQRRALAHIRFSVVRRRRFSASETLEPRAPLCDSPDCRINRDERQERARLALRCLSVRDREILERFYLREQSREQICGEMHLTDTQFRLFKSRAIARCSSFAAA